MNSSAKIAAARILGFPGVAAVSAVILGCSVYPRDFRAAVAAQPVTHVSPDGPWTGEWRSEVNGHHGPLWCVVSPGDAGRHAFRYRAGWGVMSFGDYTHVADTRSDGRGAISFAGEMELPGGAGTYAVEGKVTTDRFEARYRSDRGDRGVMTLSRPR